MTQYDKLFLKLMNGSPITHKEAIKLLSALGCKIKKGRGSRIKSSRKVGRQFSTIRHMAGTRN